MLDLFYKPKALKLEFPIKENIIMAKVDIRDKSGSRIGAQEVLIDGSIQFYDKNGFRLGSQDKKGQLKDKNNFNTNNHPFWK